MWLGFLIGIVVGANMGLVIFSLFKSGGKVRK